MAHPAGFEPATNWFEANYAIQLRHGCVKEIIYRKIARPMQPHNQAGLLFKIFYFPNRGLLKNPFLLFAANVVANHQLLRPITLLVNSQIFVGM